MGSGPSQPFFDAFTKAFNEKDTEAIAALYTEDCQWVWHSSGKSMGKEAFVGPSNKKFTISSRHMVRACFPDGRLTFESR